MSVIGEDGLKRILPRTGPDEFWQTVQDHYAGEDEQKWKYLAMLALRENAGWRLDHIGLAFGHPNKGHVTRCLKQIKRELRQKFNRSPNLHHHPEEHEADRQAGARFPGEPEPSRNPKSEYRNPKQSRMVQ